jgi:flagellar hook-associated protein 1 FlgK
MMNLFSAIELGKNSLMAQQQVFQIIGHNIANVNTPGYSRQIAQLETVAPSVIGLKSGGRGVNLLGIASVRDRFINGQIVGRKQYEGKFNELSSVFTSVEALFTEANDLGISKSLSNFFTGWSNVANQPEDVPSRNSLIYAAQSLSNKIKNSYQQLRDSQKIQDGQIEVLVNEINAIAAEIAELNEKIAYAGNTATPTGDLVDKRDKRIKELSEKVGINVYYNQNNNSATIEVAGRPLVSAGTHNTLSVQKNPANYNYFDVYMNEFGGSAVNITSDIKNGQMEALLLARDTYIPGYIDKLNNLAFNLTYNINAIHQTGYALDTTTTDLNFFAMSTGQGTITATAGNTVTFGGLAGNVSTVLNVGDMISIGGQSRRITAINDPNQITIETAFNPDPPIGLPAAWEFMNYTNAASMIDVAANIVADPTLIAASGEVDAGPPPSGAVGDNQIALQLAELINSLNVIDTDNDGVADYGTFHNYLHSLFSDVGNDSYNATYELESSQSMLAFLENKRDSISAVSLDEEAATLMQAEKAYQAIAQFLGTVNKLTDVLINVGR